jgi:serine/threonine protein kinase
LYREKSDPTLHSLFDEINIMAAQNHEHICKVYGVAVHEANKIVEVSLVLEYAPQGTLKGLLHSGAPLPWNERLSLALQAASAVNYLHTARAPMLHRGMGLLARGRERERERRGEAVRGDRS